MSWVSSLAMLGPLHCVKLATVLPCAKYRPASSTSLKGFNSRQPSLESPTDIFRARNALNKALRGINFPPHTSRPSRATALSSITHIHWIYGLFRRRKSEQQSSSCFQARFSLVRREIRNSSHDHYPRRLPIAMSKPCSIQVEEDHQRNSSWRERLILMFCRGYSGNLSYYFLPANDLLSDYFSLHIGPTVKFTAFSFDPSHIACYIYSPLIYEIYQN